MRQTFILLVCCLLPALSLLHCAASSQLARNQEFDRRRCDGEQFKYQEWPRLRVSCPWPLRLKNYRPSAADLNLVKAAGAGDMDGVRAALDDGASVDARAPDYNAKGQMTDPRNTALLEAMSWGHWKVAEFLLQRGANVNAIGTNCDTPLILATTSKKIPIMKELIRRGAKMDYRGTLGSTALSSAVFAKSLPATRALVQGGANVNAFDVYCTSIVQRAAGTSTLEIVQYLVRKGADIHKRSYYGYTPLLAAAFSTHDRRDIIRFLVKSGADLRAREWRGLTALGLAELEKNKKHMDVLRELGLTDPGRDRTRDKKK